jgi:hypothetical protein
MRNDTCAAVAVLAFVLFCSDRQLRGIGGPASSIMPSSTIHREILTIQRRAVLGM